MFSDDRRVAVEVNLNVARSLQWQPPLSTLPIINVPVFGYHYRTP